MKKLYEFRWDCGRMGSVSGIFVADSRMVDKAVGKQVYFGEILGKHSDVYGVLEEKDLTIKSEDQDFIAKLLDVFDNNRNISGYNPLDYLSEYARP